MSGRVERKRLRVAMASLKDISRALSKPVNHFFYLLLLPFLFLFFKQSANSPCSALPINQSILLLLLLLLLQLLLHMLLGQSNHNSCAEKEPWWRMGPNHDGGSWDHGIMESFSSKICTYSCFGEQLVAFGREPRNRGVTV